MGFESRRFKVVFKTLETLGILAEFQGVFLLKFSVFFFSSNFSGVGPPLFNGQWCSIYRQSFVGFLNVKWRQYHAIDADLLLEKVHKKL